MHLPLMSAAAATTMPRVLSTQQIVGRLFDPQSIAPIVATWKAARLIDQFRDGFSPVQIVWQLTGQLRRARDLLVERVRNDRWAMHGTAIGVHGIVQALARMRQLRALPTCEIPGRGRRPVAVSRAAKTGAAHRRSRTRDAAGE